MHARRLPRRAFVAVIDADPRGRYGHGCVRPEDPSPRISELLETVQSDEKRATAELVPLLYDELRSLARTMLARERPGQTLQPTALVNEAFLRVAGSDDPGWDGRGHLFGAVAEAMRRILINRARDKARLKRGGDRERVDFDLVELAIDAPDERVLEVDEALQSLEQANPRHRKVVNLRYFAGFSTRETAAALGLAEATVRKDWLFIRAWLRDALGTSDAG